MELRMITALERTIELSRTTALERTIELRMTTALKDYRTKQDYCTRKN